jgi:alginate O-acetyltransferase complex protein AlgI
MISWTFFRAATLPDAISMIGAMFGWAATAPAAYAPAWYLSREVLLALAAGIIGSTPVVPWVADRWRRIGLDAGEHRLLWVPSLVGVAALFALLAASLSMSAAQTYNPFIYFRF